MAKKTRKISPLKPKLDFAVLCLVLAAAWAGFAFTFPFETYSLFFSETQVWGSIVLLVFAGVVVSGLFSPAAAAILKRDVSWAAVPVNAALLTVFINIYSVYRYSSPYLLIICVVVHLAAVSLFFGSAPPLGKSRKPKNAEKTDVLLMVTAAAVYLSCSYFLYMLIFQTLLNVFVRTAGD